MLRHQASSVPLKRPYPWLIPPGEVLGPASEAAFHRVRECSRMSPERLRPSLRYGPMLLAWNSKFGPRARSSDSSHSREPMDVNAAGGPLAIG